MGPQKWLSPFPQNGLWFLNHSCRPNVGRKGLRTIVAMKKINAGDEITLDYSTTEEW
jgi:SET domain-containing protein